MSFERNFIVGCPRSGTTLLQALLGAHSLVFTVPESHFFRKSFLGRRAFILRGWQASGALKEWLEQIHQEQFVRMVPRTLSRSPIVNAFVEIMDELAAREGCSQWIEKTPSHIFVIDVIKRYLPEARFIHIIRDGRAVVASLFDAYSRFPQTWRKKRSLSELVDLWNTTTQISCSYLTQQDHYLVRYEELTSSPGKVISDVCNFLNLEFEEEMLELYQQAADTIIFPNQEWVQGASKPILHSNLEKYETIFNKKEQHHIEGRLSTFAKCY